MKRATFLHTERRQQSHTVDCNVSVFYGQTQTGQIFWWPLLQSAFFFFFFFFSDLRTQTDYIDHPAAGDNQQLSAFVSFPVATNRDGTTMLHVKQACVCVCVCVCVFPLAVLSCHFTKKKWSGSCFSVRPHTPNSAPIVHINQQQSHKDLTGSTLCDRALI